MQVKSILTHVTYDDKHPKLEVLLDTERSREIRIAFQSGQHLKEHQAAVPILIQVVEGEIDFGTEGGRQALPTGTLIALEPNVPHDLIATKQSIVRLSLHKDVDGRVDK
ncbi:AraC family ligand binding domain-containing protein [Sphingobacterium suaedae]|uniref:AraC family ligand binding domain-containing protein n=1 Tax=Sphingobacterium suaedae TaxID=1686402 RepID=A0ABW5KEK3_9SPHI